MGVGGPAVTDALGIAGAVVDAWAEAETGVAGDVIGGADELCVVGVGAPVTVDCRTANIPAPTPTASTAAPATIAGTSRPRAGAAGGTDAVDVPTNMSVPVAERVAAGRPPTTAVASSVASGDGATLGAGGTLEGRA